MSVALLLVAGLVVAGCGIAGLRHTRRLASGFYRFAGASIQRAMFPYSRPDPAGIGDRSGIVTADGLITRR
jgi:hypothetical protein